MDTSLCARQAPRELLEELSCITRALVRPGRGLLAADETPETMGKRLAEVGLPNDEETRRQFRQLLVGAGPELARYVSGIILQDETLQQRGDDGELLVERIKQLGIIPGVKADLGLVPLAGTDDETTTLGLDSLAQRLLLYKTLGCDFAKWRCTLRIGPGTPSALAISENANVLARFAAICQASIVVPVLEPEVLADGAHHLAQAQIVSEALLAAVYKALAEQHVLLEGTLLKPSMVTAGTACPTCYPPVAVAHATVTALRRTVPAAVPGILFLSGGQSEEQATLHLTAINRVPLSKPWALSFSFGRGLQASALRAWGGRAENIARAQAELLKRAKANSFASLGEHHGGGAVSINEYDESTTVIIEEHE